MIMKTKSLSNKRGGVLLEFAMSSLLFLTVLFGTLEWSLEIFARQSTERALAASLHIYVISRDEAAADAAALNEVGGFIGRCLSSEFRIYDTIAGVDLLGSSSGRAPAGNASDDSAAFVKVVMTCNWPRMTPLTAYLLGRELIYTTTGVARIES
jgi:hypothetical protein